MKYQEQIETLMEKVKNRVELTEGEELSVRKGLIDGFLQIEWKEQEERKKGWKDIPVEHVMEGFAFWNRGGFAPERNRGQAMLAAGMDGGRLRRVRFMSECNGRHSLAVVYPGCYISEAVAVDLYVPAIAVYRIREFVQQEDGWAARCQAVYMMTPCMCTVDEKLIARLVGMSGDLALTPNLYKLDW